MDTPIDEQIKMEEAREQKQVPAGDCRCRCRGCRGEEDGHSSEPLELVQRFADRLLWHNSRALLSSFCNRYPRRRPDPDLLDRQAITSSVQFPPFGWPLEPHRVFFVFFIEARKLRSLVRTSASSPCRQGTRRWTDIKADRFHV